jgi:sugar phosphate isomerase/epimerase
VAIAEMKLREGDEEAQVAALRASGLVATVCLPANIGPLPLRPPLIYPGPDAVNERVVLMCSSIERLAAFDPDCICMVTGSSQGYSQPHAWQMAVEGLRVAARVAVDNDTRIALEMIRGDLGYDFGFLHTLPEAVAFLDEVGSPAIGLCYDFYHLWDTDDVLEHTERYANRVFGVQYNDWHEPPRSSTGADRLVPGDGVIDIPGILGALERGGFTGWYDFELFSDDGRWGTDLPDSLWKLPYNELLNKAHAGFLHAWEARNGAAHPTG